MHTTTAPELFPAESITHCSIDGIEYRVVGVSAVPCYPDRHEFRLQRPRGERIYHAVRYATGAISSVV